jgi:transposase
MVMLACSVTFLKPQPGGGGMLELTDHAFNGVWPLLPAGSRRGKPWRDHRQVLGGILWKLHTGRPWRDMPERFGPWQACHSRLRRWQRDGTWPRVWAVLAAEQARSRDDRRSQVLLPAAPVAAARSGLMAATPPRPPTAAAARWAASTTPSPTSSRRASAVEILIRSRSATKAEGTSHSGCGFRVPQMPDLAT